MKQRRLTHQEKSELFAKYETGKYTSVDLAKEYPVSSTAISALLKRHGYRAKTQSELQRKYEVNESFFDVIDTEEKAYFLGILYADGTHITERNAVTISLKESDKYLLQKLNNLLQPTKPLQYIRLKNNNHSNQYRLTIQNKIISKRMLDLGLVKAKTHKITFPIWLKKPLIRHFVRGYFDGDGCVSNRIFSIVGTDDFLTDTQNMLIKELGLSKTKFYKRHKESSNNIVEIRYCGKNNLKKIMNWFYSDATIYLERKYEKFKNYV